jgi:SMC interacting uncharacterized protein involved in chromosome segregation
MWKQVLGSVLLAFALSGCVVAYKTEGVVSSLNQSMGSLDQTFGQIDADYREKSILFERTLKDGADRRQEPYKSLQTALAKMKASHANVAQRRNGLIQDKTELEAEIAGRDRIRSDEPAYTRLNATEKKWKAAFKYIEKEMKEYQSASHDFVKGAERGGLRKVDTNVLRQQATKLDSDYSSVVAQIQSGVENIKSQVQQQSESLKTHNLPLVSKAQEVADSIRKQEPEVRRALAALISSLEPGQVLLVGPKSKSHAELLRLEAIIRQINAKTGEIQSLVGQLKRQ